MRIAVPVESGVLCTHFGRCRTFALIDVDPVTGAMAATVSASPPPHAPGVLPEWISQQAVTHVLAGGIGEHAQRLLAGFGVEVVSGVPVGPPEDVARRFLEGRLAPGPNACDH